MLSFRDNLEDHLPSNSGLMEIFKTTLTIYNINIKVHTQTCSNRLYYESNI